LFPKNVTTEEIIDTLEKTFKQKINTPETKQKVKELNRSLEEIIIFASIVEKESTKDAQQEVANILWERLNIDMPLQVDATFVYSINKGTFDLTQEDLKNGYNPYNTYTHKGLPPTPIGNPGLSSIEAVLNPTSTENLYFLTGKDGEMYYASNFEQHKRNRALYLD
jgi:UPF0755 protein